MRRLEKIVEWTCVVAAALMVFVGCMSDESSVQQAICNRPVESVDCPGQSCTPIGQCTDDNLQDGTCCGHSWHHPADPVFQGATCTNPEPGMGDPSCVKTNSYFTGTLFEVTCTTVIYWVTQPDGSVKTLKYVDCYYSA